MFVRPNILRTLRRTMIRFLIEHLVRRIWFGQSRLYFILNWLVMRCKLRPELAADAQQTAWWKCRLKSSQVKSVYFNHPSQGNSTNYYLILCSPRQGCAFHKSTNKQIAFEASEEPSDTVTHFYFCFFLHLQESSALSQSEAMIVQQGECSQNMLSEGFWTPNIAWTNTSN